MSLQMVDHEFGELFPDKVWAVNPVHDTTALEKLVAKYEKAAGTLTDLVDD